MSTNGIIISKRSFRRHAVILLFMVTALVLQIFQMPVYAACETNPNSVIPTPAGLPTLGCEGNTSVVELVVKTVFGALAMVSLLFIVIGGLRYTLSGGDGNAIAGAKKTILYAVIGLVVGVSTFIIIGYVFSWLEA